MKSTPGLYTPQGAGEKLLECYWPNDQGSHLWQSFFFYLLDRPQLFDVLAATQTLPAWEVIQEVVDFSSGESGEMLERFLLTMAYNNHPVKEQISWLMVRTFSFSHHLFILVVKPSSHRKVYFYTSQEPHGEKARKVLSVFYIEKKTDPEY